MESKENNSDNPIDTSMERAMEAYFNETANRLGIPANRTGNVGLENILGDRSRNLIGDLTISEERGRNILFRIISNIGDLREQPSNIRDLREQPESKDDFSYTDHKEEVEGIWNAALGFVVGGGVCDNYSSYICYLAANNNVDVDQANRNTVQTLQKGGHSTALVNGVEIDPHLRLVYRNRNGRTVGDGGHRITWNMPIDRRQHLFDVYSERIRNLLEDQKEALFDKDRSDLEAFQNLPRGYRTQINSFLQGRSAADQNFKAMKKKYLRNKKKYERAYTIALDTKNSFNYSNFHRDSGLG